MNKRKRSYSAPNLTPINKMSKIAKNKLDTLNLTSNTIRRRVNRNDLKVINDPRAELKTYKYVSNAPYNNHKFNTDSYLNAIFAPEVTAKITKYACLFPLSHDGFTPDLDSTSESDNIRCYGVSSIPVPPERQTWFQFNIMGLRDKTKTMHNSHPTLPSKALKQRWYSTQLDMADLWKKSFNSMHNNTLKLIPTSTDANDYSGSNTDDFVEGNFSVNSQKHFYYRGGYYKLYIHNTSTNDLIFKFYEYIPRQVCDASDTEPMRLALLDKINSAPRYSNTNTAVADLDPALDYTNVIHANTSITKYVGQDVDDISDIDFKPGYGTSLSLNFVAHKCKIFTLKPGDKLEYEVEIPAWNCLDGSIIQDILNKTIANEMVPAFTKILCMSVKGAKTVSQYHIDHDDDPNTSNVYNHTAEVIAGSGSFTIYQEEKHTAFARPYYKNNYNIVINELNEHFDKLKARHEKNMFAQEYKIQENHADITRVNLDLNETDNDNPQMDIPDDNDL